MAFSCGPVVEVSADPPANYIVGWFAFLRFDPAVAEPGLVAACFFGLRGLRSPFFRFCSSPSLSTSFSNSFSSRLYLTLSALALSWYTCLSVSDKFYQRWPTCFMISKTCIFSFYFYIFDLVSRTKIMYADKHFLGRFYSTSPSFVAFPPLAMKSFISLSYLFLSLLANSSNMALC